MAQASSEDLMKVIEELRREVAALSERVARVAEPAALVAAAAPIPAAQPKAVEPEPGITEEEVLAISAALAAYLGVRVHIRQIRLIGSRAWAQEGRVSIQASHRLHS